MLSKKILKELEVLYLRKKDSEDEKIKRIVEVFFKALHSVSTEDEAWDIYTSMHITLVLIDVDFREENGLSFIKKVRTSDKKLPIIVITKNIQLATLLGAIKLNLTDYLIKPLDVSAFINALNEASKIIFSQTALVAIVPNVLTYNYVDKNLYHKNSPCKLTKKETRLLEYFLKNPNTLLQKEEIKKVVWQNKIVSESGFKSLLKRLSDKLGYGIIENSFGIGYSFKL